MKVYRWKKKGTASKVSDCIGVCFTWSVRSKPMFVAKSRGSWGWLKSKSANTFSQTSVNYSEKVYCWNHSDLHWICSGFYMNPDASKTLRA